MLNEFDEPEIIVWRTHDVDVALVLASEHWADLWGASEPLPVPILGWFRTVPWGEGDYSSLVEQLRENSGTPAILFR
jgi:hypothetical protein